MESRLTLKGKVAFVTGSTRGIGWATAQLLAQEGATVVLNGNAGSTLLQSRIDELRSTWGVTTDGFDLDVGNPEDVRQCYSEIAKKHKRLDILVNNAGILEDSLLGMIRPENITDVFRTNVEGTILNMQYASRLMARYKSGSIVNISSIIGRNGNAGQVVYGGSKAAIIGITLSAAKELGPSNIRVNAVAPGFIDTRMIQHLPPDKYAERMSSIKMGRIGQPEDVAKAVLFLASDDASYITGQVLGVDGGMLI